MYGVLIGVLVVILSAVIHPVSGSAPTDLLLVLLTFAAGLQQIKDQWRIALWLVLATVIVSLPFVELSRFNGNLDPIPWATLRDALTCHRSGWFCCCACRDGSCVHVLVAPQPVIADRSCWLVDTEATRDAPAIRPINN